MALVTTPEAADANSYASVQEYKDFWGARPYSTVPLALSDADIEIYLMWACILLTGCFKWRGVATTPTQALPFPRMGLLTATGYALDKDTNPVQLKNAQSQWAGQLAIDAADRTLDDPDSKVLGSESAVTSVSAGPVSVSFDSNRFSDLESFDAYIRSLSSDFAYLSKFVPDAVRMLLVPTWYLEGQLKRKVLFGAF